MTRAITVRLDEANHAELEQQAQRIGVRPGTLARVLLHSGLTDGPSRPTHSGRAALDRLVKRSQRQNRADAVALVAEARADLVPETDPGP